MLCGRGCSVDYMGSSAFRISIAAKTKTLPFVVSIYFEIFLCLIGDLILKFEGFTWPEGALGNGKRGQVLVMSAGIRNQ